MSTSAINTLRNIEKMLGKDLGNTMNDSPEKRPFTIRYICPNCKGFRNFKPTGRKIDGSLEYKCSVCTLRFLYRDGKIRVVKEKTPMHW